MAEGSLPLAPSEESMHNTLAVMTKDRDDVGEIIKREAMRSMARARNLLPCRLSAEDSRAGSTVWTWSKKIVWS